ncbi:MAG TPA: hypothetical protein DCZ55_04120 [Cyanobacteria bacterium UBA11371]|nr:hypothetical protein [Cyanobacteria bacterium UBA8543]HAZ43672.1 hypothetical protein [Cyanobacteria bacterium UBA11371]
MLLNFYIIKALDLPTWFRFDKTSLLERLMQTRRSPSETKIAIAQTQFSLLGLKKLAQNERSPPDL